MPISSGAAGRTGAENRTQGSYLKMYLGTLPREKRALLENALEAERSSASAGGREDHVPSKGQQGVQEETHRCRSVDGGQLKRPPSKKSSTCTVL